MPTDTVVLPIFTPSASLNFTAPRKPAAEPAVITADFRNCRRPDTFLSSFFEYAVIFGLPVNKPETK